MTTMSKDNKKVTREPLNLKISYENKEDLMGTCKNPQLRGMIVKSTLSGIKTAIENGDETTHICDISNQYLKVNLHQTDFKASLEFMIKHYEGTGDFEECIKIKSLIDKI